MRPNNYPIVISGLCGTASFASSSCWAMDVVRASFQIVISSGSCVGTFRLEASNDLGYGQPGRPVGNYIPTNWNIVGSVTTVTASSTATLKSFMLPAVETSYQHLRIVYLDGSAGAALGLFDVRANTIGL